MTFQLSPELWEPQRRGCQETIDLLNQGKRVCLYSPTGGGKTKQAMELFRWAQYQGMGATFYVNRKLLISQTAKRFYDAGLNYGIRASEYDDMFDQTAPFQITSADTERVRVFDKKTWTLHDSGLIVVDEAHIQKTETMRKILDCYEQAGAKIVLLTATPIGLSKWADEIVISGRIKEYRDCNALVPAKVFSHGQPDMSKIKRSKTGEFVLDGRKTQVYTQHIVGHVVEMWKEHNPDARPTMLFAPGKPESVWLTEHFTKIGVNWCHIDATDAVVDGKRYKLTRNLYEEILERFKDGNIKGLSSRFKLREGVDVPSVYHCILATPIGSLASYIQTVGRVLRYSPETSDHVIITDHGGNYLRHGSPNHDRDWKLWWTLPEHVVSEMHTNLIRDKKIPEPICCHICKHERTFGHKCPKCGFEHGISKRHVAYEDGEFREHDGDLVPRRAVQIRSQTLSDWCKMFWGFKKKGTQRTLAQLYGFFCHEKGYAPPRDMPFMPKYEEGWNMRASEIDMRTLYNKQDSPSMPELMAKADAGPKRPKNSGKQQTELF